MAKEDMDKYLKRLKEEERIVTLIKNYGLDISLTKTLIVFYEFKIPAKKVAQRLGIHTSTIERYFEQFGQMLESDFNSIFNFYIKKQEGLNSSQP